MAQHAAPRHSSRRKFLLVAVPVLSVLLLAGVAVAAFLLRAPITGGGTTGQVTLAWSGTATANGACTAVREGEAVRISFDSVLPGDSCKVNGAVDYTATKPIKVQAPTFITAPGVSVAFTPNSGIQTGDVLTGHRTPAVELMITFGPGLVPGQTLAADATAGITAVDTTTP